MGFYKLEKKEYTKVSREFRNTYVGGRLYLIFAWFRALAIISCVFDFIDEVIVSSIIDNQETTSDNIISLLSNISFWLCILAALISYYVYFNHLKKYFEAKKKK